MESRMAFLKLLLRHLVEVSVVTAALSLLPVLLCTGSARGNALDGWGVVAGAGLSDLGSRVQIPEEGGMHLGPQGGVFLAFLDGRLQTELLYVERGVYEGEWEVVNEHGDLLGRYRVDSRASYLNVPVLLRQSFALGGLTPYVGAGGALGVFLGYGPSYSSLGLEEGKFRAVSATWLVELGLSAQLGRLALVPALRYESALVNAYAGEGTLVFPRAIQMSLAVRF